ncbi:MAG TPA: ATP-binding protein [Alphaproteobacteria bacterium]|nr:ATP-binding protein [Alphaproteobacteria bacterium]
MSAVRSRWSRRQHWIGLSVVAAAAVVFAVWQAIKLNPLQWLDYRWLHDLYTTYGVALAVLFIVLASGHLLARRRTYIAQVRQAERKYRGLIEGARDAIVVFDHHGTILEWNPQAARLFGFDRDEVIGRPLPTLREDARPEFMERLAQLVEGRDEESAFKYADQRVTKHGEALAVSLSIFPLRDEAGHVTAFVETCCDVRSCAQLIRQVQELEKMSSMGQLAAGVAHQLNTPLGSALLRAQMLEEDLSDAEQVEDLRFIQRQLRYGKEIVESLLRFARPSGESKRAEPLNAIVHEVLAMMEPNFRRVDVRVRVELAATEDALVYIARNELEQVFFNLVSNALDAMPQGGEITITTQMMSNKRVGVRFHDTGIGIPPARLTRIFEPFYTTKEPGKGTGLGLAICQRIIKEAGGSIEVASEVGLGTTFTIWLPRANKASGTTRAEPDCFVHTVSTASAGTRIEGRQTHHD